MKITKEKSEKNRQNLLESAARLFCERGVDGTGVADICKNAGLTHGALYSHFESKDDLAAEALAYELGKSLPRMKKVGRGKEPTLASYLENYLSADHRDNIAGGCPIAASTSEIARHGSSLSNSFTNGFLQMVDAVESVLNPARKKENHRRALMIVSTMIGAVAAARATAKSDADLSNEILADVRELLIKLDDPK
jgi:TetR/AcrR family transcriptional repressor of nem operon